MRNEKGWICLEGKDGQSADIKMLQHNKIDGFLELRVRYVDEKCLFYYDVCGLCSLEEYLNRNPLDYKNIRSLYMGVLKSLKNGKAFFLQEENYMLLPEYIFWNERKGEWRICYYPDFHKEIQKQLEELNEFLLKKLDHKEKRGVEFLYEIYDFVKREGFYPDGIEEYIRDFSKNKQSEKEGKEADEGGEKKRKKEGSPTFYLVQTSEEFAVPNQVEITSGDFRIGRLESNDLVLPVGEISRRHGKITLDRNRLFLYDCQSTNGTFWNGKKIAGNREVSCGEKDIISFGTISYEIRKS